MTIQQKLRELLKLHTHAKVAAAANVSIFTLRSILEGDHEPRISTARKLADVLGVEYGWLIDDRRGWPPARVQPAGDRQSEIAVA